MKKPGEKENAIYAYNPKIKTIIKACCQASKQCGCLSFNLELQEDVDDDDDDTDVIRP